MNYLSRNFILSIVFIFLFQSLTAQKQKSILFVGNSHIFYSEMPSVFFRLSKSLGDTLLVGQRAPGGWILEEHSASDKTMERLRSEKWDYVVLQEGRGNLSAAWNNDSRKVIASTQTLLDSIYTFNACTRVMWNMIHPALGSPAIMNNSITLADSLGLEIAPVWPAFIDLPNNRWIDLLLDGNHQNTDGAYLTACVFYASIFHKSPENQFAYRPDGVTKTEAKLFQKTAWKIVSEDYTLWNIDTVDVVADFTVNLNENHSITINNLSLNAMEYEWDFGDQSISFEESPIHEYAEPGSYKIILHAESDCKWDQKAVGITVTDSTTSTILTQLELVEVSHNRLNKEVVLTNVLGKSILVSNSLGQTIFLKYKLKQDQIGIPLLAQADQFLFISVFDKNQKKTFKISPF